MVTIVHVHRADLSGARRRHGCRCMDRRRRAAHRRRHYRGARLGSHARPGHSRMSPLVVRLSQSIRRPESPDRGDMRSHREGSRFAHAPCTPSPDVHGPDLAAYVLQPAPSRCGAGLRRHHRTRPTTLTVGSGAAVADQLIQRSRRSTRFQTSRELAGAWQAGIDATRSAMSAIRSPLWWTVLRAAHTMCIASGSHPTTARCSRR